MNTRLTQGLLAVIALLSAIHLMRPFVFPLRGSVQGTLPASDVVRARLIELVDDNGQVVAQLHVGEDGGGQLRLRSGNGTVRIKLGTSPDGSGLVLMDADSEPAVWLAAGSEGTSITLAQQGKEQRVLTP